MSLTTEHDNLLSNIQNLQAAQSRLHTELSQLPPTGNVERQKLLITQIDNINAEKVDLFKNLHAIQSVMQHDVNTTTDDIHAKMELTNIVEQELQEAKARIEQARHENINNLRMTEINNYYSGKYGLYLKLFRYIIYTSVFLVLIALLRQRYFINSNSANVLAGIVIAIGGFYIVTSILDLSSRNNLVISEFDWAVEPDEGGSGGSHDHYPLGISGEWVDEMERYKKDIELLEKGDCLGAGCCVGDGISFDKKNMICKLDPGKKTKNEGFTTAGALHPALLDEDQQIPIVQSVGGMYYASP